MPFPILMGNRFMYAILDDRPTNSVLHISFLEGINPVPFLKNCEKPQMSSG